MRIAIAGLGTIGRTLARNLADGRVEVVAEGERGSCERLLELLRSGGTPGAVELVVDRWSAAKGNLAGFVER